MSLIGLLIVIIVIGAIAYLIKILPIDNTWKTIAYVIIAIFAVVWLLRTLQGSSIDIKI